ncbi:MAG TPA: TadE/TadG family type IV pilus assembly protein [Sphingomicrobium sp.]|nr:TadE/TadG family type IV pilus assembly protein [Sphingomicrobium sp.]
MKRARLSLRRECGGTAAAEMALVLPLLLTIMFGSLELGNYFMNEHTLVKAVRDGARFAARQSFANYPDCSTVSTTARDSTRNVVMNGALAGGSIITPNIESGDIDVTTSCAADAGGETMSGIYAGRANGAQIVTVSATVAYRPVVSAFGFTGIGLNLNAASQAAVTGI